MDASICGLKYPSGCHKLQNEGSESRIQWKMAEILLLEGKVVVAASKGKNWHILKKKIILWSLNFFGVFKKGLS